jgi:hypothetical protein
MSLTLPYPTLGPGVVNSAELVLNFSAIASKFGSIDNSDIKAVANIALSKLAASYEYMVVRLSIDDMTLLYTGNAAPVSGGNPRCVDFCPIYDDGKGAWTYVATAWCTTDTGAGTGVFKIFWGVFNGGAAAVVPAVTLGTGAAELNTIDTITIGGTANIQSQGSDASPAVTSLVGGTNRFLMLGVSTADAAATSPLYVSVHLKRQIAT